ALPREGPPPDRARARPHRQARPLGLFPDRLGPRELLPAGADPRPGPGLGREQRRLLQPRPHRRRSPGPGPPVRAPPVGGARGGDRDLALPGGDRRERVIQYVYERYGARGAAMTANVITYRDRSASREIGKVLGFPPEEIDRLSRFMRRFEYVDPNDTLETRL